MMALEQTTPRLRTVPAAHGIRLKDWFAMDARRTDALGWAFNLAIFRIVFLAFAALPSARHVVTWTAHVMPSLPPSVWHPISFYRHIPLGTLTNAGLAHWLSMRATLFACGAGLWSWSGTSGSTRPGGLARTLSACECTRPGTISTRTGRTCWSSG